MTKKRCGSEFTPAAAGSFCDSQAIPEKPTIPAALQVEEPPPVRIPLRLYPGVSE